MEETRWVEKTFRKKAPLRHIVLSRYFWLANILEIPSAFFRSAHQLRAEASVSLAHQILGLLQTTFLCGLRAREYYLFRFDQITDSKLRMEFLSQRRYFQWLGLLNVWLRDESCWDKLDFNSFCTKYRLPTPSILAIYKDGIKKSLDDAYLNQDDSVIFCKPDDGSCGIGIESWRHGNGSFHRQGRSLCPSEFDSYLGKKSLTTTYLLQPRIENHPELAGLSNGSLPTVRFNTYIDTDGCIEEFWPVFRMPCRESIVDNYQADNMVAPVDLQTGRLGKAVIRKNGVILEAVVHPDTGSIISGTQLPFWAEVRALCRQAQKCCEKERFVGWDVALTVDGPILIEANPSFGIELLQVAHRQGIKSASLFPTLEELMRMMLEDSQPT